MIDVAPVPAQGLAAGLYLVTGGAGFIGSNVVSTLAALGARVVIVDRFGCGDKWRNVAKARIHDFVTIEALEAWLERNRQDIAGVIHMGAISATTETDCDLIIRNNFRLTIDLWSWCTRTDTPFIYASSAAVYGNGAMGFQDLEDASALGALRPLNPYGWSKLASDRRILADKQAPSKWAGLRFFNVYGPNEYHKETMRSVVAVNYPKVARGEAISLFRSCRPDYADGCQMRDFVWVGDCVGVILWMLRNPFPPGVYNVGSGMARSWLELADALFSACGKDPRIDFIDMPPALQGKYQYYTCADIAKLRAAGYSAAMTGIEAGIAKYVSSYLAQDDCFV
jgi:ADP-L-glycero-D-manno-heptose 6-epimerase